MEDGVPHLMVAEEGATRLAEPLGHRSVVVAQQHVVAAITVESPMPTICQLRGSA